MISRASAFLVAFAVVITAGGLESRAPFGVAQGSPERSRGAPFEIRTLSSRADLVSGGDTLIAISQPGLKSPLSERGLTVTLNGKDLTDRLAPDAGGEEWRGLIDGLRIGVN